MRIKYLILSTVALLAAMILLSCGSDGETPSTDTSMPGFDLTGCVIIRPDMCDDAELKAAVKLRDTLQAISGGVFYLGNDFVSAHVSDRAEHEILVGAVNDPASIAAREGLADNEYVIIFSGSKLILSGGSPEATAYAVDSFLEKYCSYSGDTPETGVNMMIEAEDFKGVAVFEHNGPIPVDAESWKSVSGSKINVTNDIITVNSRLEYLDFSSDGSYGAGFSFRFSESPNTVSVSLYFNYIRRGSSTAQMRFTVDSSGLIALATPGYFKDLHFRTADEVKGDMSLRVEVQPDISAVLYYLNGALLGVAPMTGDEVLLDGEASVAIEVTGGTAEVWDFSAADIAALTDNPVGRYTATEPSPDPEKLFPRATKAPADTIYVVENPYALTPDRQLTLATLQGLCNRDEPRIYVKYNQYNSGFNPGEQAWTGLLTDSGRTLIPATLDELLVLFADCYDGLIVGDAFTADNVSFEPNIVTTMAGVRDAVYVGQQDLDGWKDKLGKPVIFVTLGKWSGALEAYKWAYDNLFSECNQSILAHLYGFSALHSTMPCRDYIVANKIFAFYSCGVQTLEDYNFYLGILASTPTNTPVIGMTTEVYAAGEKGVFTEGILFNLCGYLGKYFLYTFSVPNMSLMSSLEYGTLRQSKPEPVEAGNFDYASFMISEGENYSWMYHLWEDSYNDTRRADIAKGWSISGAAYWLAPAAVGYYYDNATPADCFYLDGGGVCDVGSPDTFGLYLAGDGAKRALARSLSDTAFVMEKLDLTVLRIISTVSDDAIRLYTDAIDCLEGIYTGYNIAEASATRASYVIDGVAVFRCLVTHGDGTPASAAAQITQAVSAFGSKQGFMNVFILGNSVIPGMSHLIEIEKAAPASVKFLRPDTMSQLLINGQSNSK